MAVGKPKTLKLRNRQILLDFLRNSRETTVAEVSERIGLSKPTVKKMLAHYVAKGLVTPVGKGDSTEEGGKKPELFRFNPEAGYVIAFHQFPEELYAAIFDLNLRMLQDVAIPHPPDLNIETLTDKIVQTIFQFLAAQDLKASQLIGVAIGSHGVVNSATGVVVTSPHFPSWGENVRFKEILQAKLPWPVTLCIDNQIRFQVFGERTFGVAKNKKNVVVLEGGNGLVTGLFVKNEIKRGAHGLAGEIGHMIINPTSPEICPCGGRGCFETMVEVKRVLALVESQAHDYQDSQLAQKQPISNVRIEDVFAASNAGDRLACAVMDDVIKWFAIGLSNLIVVADPDMIVFQGIYAGAGAYFLHRLREELNHYALLNVKKDVELRYSAAGKERGVRGGAAYMIAEYFKNEAFYEI